MVAAMEGGRMTIPAGLVALLGMLAYVGALWLAAQGWKECRHIADRRLARRRQLMAHIEAIDSTLTNLANRLEIHAATVDAHTNKKGAP